MMSPDVQLKYIAIDLKTADLFPEKIYQWENRYSAAVIDQSAVLQDTFRQGLIFPKFVLESSTLKALA